MVDSIQLTAEETGPEAPTTPEQPPERPEWLPEKFKTPEDMAKAYGELEGKLGGGQDDKGEKGEEGPPGDLKITPSDNAAAEQAEDMLSKAGLNMQDYAEEFATNGQLSEETYSKLDEAGFPREIVDQYVAGQQAVAEQMSSSIFQTVGGQEAYQGMAEWAGKNFTQAEAEAYNTAMDSGNMETIKLAVQGLQARYVAANGQDPNLVRGGSAPSGAKPFASNAELGRAMDDPRYSTDKAYREGIHARLAVSNL